MKVTLLFLLMSSVFCSFGQKELVGLIIRFDTDTDPARKLEILKAQDDPSIGNSTHLEGFEVTLVELEEISQLQAEEIAASIESEEEVLFTSYFYKTPEGGYGGDLDQILVKVNKDTDWSLVSAYDFSPKKGFEDIWEVQITKDQDNIRAIQKEFIALGIFDIVMVNTFHSVLACTEPYYEYQWALQNEGTAIQYEGTPGADMNVNDAWSVTTGSPTIKIAVLDSGTDTNHVDLIDNLLPGFDATGGGTEGYPNLTYPNDAHGTCTAGIVAANGENEIGITGVAYTAKIIPIRIFYYINFIGDIIPFTSGEAGLSGVNWAVNEADADILSNSWGLRDSDIELLGIDTAMSNMVLVNAINSGRGGKGSPALFSSGNEWDDYSIWPAIHPATISVGASTMCDELKTPSDCSPESWWGSNFGDGLDVIAPGVGVLSTDISGGDGYNGFMDEDYSMFNGTSAACPNAAGVVALLLSAEPEMTGAQARAVLSVTATKVSGYDYDISGDFGLRSFQTGYGRVNAGAAIDYAGTSLNLEEFSEEETQDYVSYQGSNLVLFLAEEAKSLEVYSLSGALVSSTSLEGSLTHSFAEETFSDGMYLLRIVREEKTTQIKVVF